MRAQLVLFFTVLLVACVSCTPVFVSITQALGCQDRLRNDLGLRCIGSGVVLHSASLSVSLCDRWKTARIARFHNTGMLPAADAVPRGAEYGS